MAVVPRTLRFHGPLSSTKRSMGGGGCFVIPFLALLGGLVKVWRCLQRRSSLGVHFTPRPVTAKGRRGRGFLFEGRSR